jgi:hypothetical protein
MVPMLMFSYREWRSLRALRQRYQRDRDLFSERERAHLCFLRWLYHTGRLTP